jgi:hypothetical protein
MIGLFRLIEKIYSFGTYELNSYIIITNTTKNFLFLNCNVWDSRSIIWKVR